MFAFAAPELIFPEDGAPFHGQNTIIELKWKSVGELEEGQWYLVNVRYKEGGQVRESGTLVKETVWMVPAEFFYAKADQPDRAYQWQVQVVQVVKDETGQERYVPMSPPSETRTFHWY